MAEPSFARSWLMSPGGEKRVREAVNRVLAGSRPADEDERRGDPRWPFFGPVTITLDHDPFPQFSAFARDISHLGVGLLHIMPLERGEVIVTIRGEEGEDPVALRTQVMWCKDCGEGWYISGGRFLDVVGP